MSSGAVFLLVGFGGPVGPDSVRPFVDAVLEGRRVPADRKEHVVQRYLEAGGVSPYNAAAEALRAALADALADGGGPADVRLGMRFGDPHISEVVAGVLSSSPERVVAVALSPQEGPAATGRYVDALEAAVAASDAGPLPGLTWLTGWHRAPGLVDAWADAIADAASRLTPERRARTELVFCAHSVPLRDTEPYEAQVRDLAEGVAARLGWPAGRWCQAWQSRSGRPQDPWLEPDIGDRLAELAAGGRGDAIVAPIGFLLDNLEVELDLQVDARRAGRAAGIEIDVVAPPSGDPAVVADLAARLRERASEG